MTCDRGIGDADRRPFDAFRVVTFSGLMIAVGAEAKGHNTRAALAFSLSLSHLSRVAPSISRNQPVPFLPAENLLLREPSLFHPPPGAAVPLSRRCGVRPSSMRRHRVPVDVSRGGMVRTYVTFPISCHSGKGPLHPMGIHMPRSRCRGVFGPFDGHDDDSQAGAASRNPRGRLRVFDGTTADVCRRDAGTFGFYRRKLDCGRSEPADRSRTPGGIYSAESNSVPSTRIFKSIGAYLAGAHRRTLRIARVTMKRTRFHSLNNCARICNDMHV